jgi:hypothetical protein
MDRAALVAFDLAQQVRDPGTWGAQYRHSRNHFSWRGADQQDKHQEYEQHEVPLFLENNSSHPQGDDTLTQVKRALCLCP